MELALNEVKTQAKILLKAVKIDSNLQQKLRLPLKRLSVSNLDDIKLKHCLAIVAQQLGFDNWHHAQDILSGSEKPIEQLNMGTFFYHDSSGVFINEWFADYQQANTILLQHAENKWLLPYKNQFVVVKKDYIAEFKLNPELTPLWNELDHNMVQGYNSLAWDTLACALIKNRRRYY